MPGRLLSGISFWVLGYVESNMYKENIYDQYDRDSENNGIWQMILINGIGTGVILKAFHMAKGCNTCLKTFRMAKERDLTRKYVFSSSKNADLHFVVKDARQRYWQPDQIWPLFARII